MELAKDFLLENLLTERPDDYSAQTKSIATLDKDRMPPADCGL